MDPILRFLAVPLILLTATAHADVAGECAYRRLRIAGSYESCRLKSHVASLVEGTAVDGRRCDERYRSRWSSSSYAGSSCTAGFDGPQVEGLVSDSTSMLVTYLSGDAGALCEERDFRATGQTVSYGAGDDADLQVAGAQSFVDNGDGTVTDTRLGLQWEKKFGCSVYSGSECSSEEGSCGDPHDGNNFYSWSSTATAYDGTVVTVLLEQLNHRCSNDSSIACSSDADCAQAGGACGFAGHRDWRLPNVKEARSIVDLSQSPYSVAPALLTDGCDRGSTWTSTSYAEDPQQAWFLHTQAGGAVDTIGKSAFFAARAVRGGR
ncbi:MAG TPA: DUF1566 domain-containing protein [Candidatus Limnocylindrales bacterium]|nr:DUF1566 domain-containing protein [Candidatus Limnocylindrales bacterium]